VTDIAAIEEALAGLEPGERGAMGAVALVDLVLGALDLDEDDVVAATRRGLLLAAAAGDPRDGIGAGSRAALETAADLSRLGCADGLARRLRDLAREAEDVAAATVAETAAALAQDDAASLDALAVLLLAHAVA